MTDPADQPTVRVAPIRVAMRRIATRGALVSIEREPHPFGHKLGGLGEDRGLVLRGHRFRLFRAFSPLQAAQTTVRRPPGRRTQTTSIPGRNVSLHSSQYGVPYLSGTSLTPSCFGTVKPPY